MTDRNQAPTSPNDSADCSLAQPWTDEAFIRTAEMIAAGEMEFPQHLGENQAAQLESKIRQLRRKRLVRFIAGLIAGDLADDVSRNAESDYD